MTVAEAREAMPGASGRLMPIMRHDGRDFLLAIELMTSLPVSVLHQPIGSIAAHRDDITRAIDWRFTGV